MTFDADARAAGPLDDIATVPGATVCPSSHSDCPRDAPEPVACNRDRELAAVRTHADVRAALVLIQTVPLKSRSHSVLRSNELP